MLGAIPPGARIVSDPSPSSSDPGLSTDPAADWQPLPLRGAVLAAAMAGVSLLVPCLVVGGSILLRIGEGAPLPLPGWAAAGLIVVVALLLAGLAYRRRRRVRWLLDPQGLAVRRGGLWQSETRVPASRVQHLDLRRGPLERLLKLSTLVVHTAGSRFGAVTVAGLDVVDAERLRERLSRQLDQDDDAL
jgi:membrane protein YdbS with pleckstrin-like domain